MSRGPWFASLERTWDAARARRVGTVTPADFRIEAYVGHGGAELLRIAIEAVGEEEHRLVFRIGRQLRKSLCSFAA